LPAITERFAAAPDTPSSIRRVLTKATTKWAWPQVQ
jgi:hypothetical protein